MIVLRIFATFIVSSSVGAALGLVLPLALAIPLAFVIGMKLAFLEIGTR